MSAPRQPQKARLGYFHSSPECHRKRIDSRHSRKNPLTDGSEQNRRTGVFRNRGVVAKAGDVRRCENHRRKMSGMRGDRPPEKQRPAGSPMAPASASDWRRLGGATRSTVSLIPPKHLHWPTQGPSSAQSMGAPRFDFHFQRPPVARSQCTAKEEKSATRK